MIQKNQIYKCSVCGNTVDVALVGGGTLVCCGKEMIWMEEKKADQGSEKHVPVIAKTDKGMTVKVGSVPHPMEEKHYIQWIETVSDEAVSRKYLKPGEKPERSFVNKPNLKKVRAFCNLHGLWEGTV